MFPALRECYADWSNIRLPQSSHSSAFRIENLFVFSCNFFFEIGVLAVACFTDLLSPSMLEAITSVWIH